MLFLGVVLVGGLMLLTPSSAQADEASPIVIVHGAWGGAHHWKQVDRALSHDHGRTVHRAALTGLGERSHLVSPAVNLDTHIRDVVNLIEFEDLTSVVLVGHSYGGVVAQGVVEAIPDRIVQVIYIDSHLLNNGECYFTHHPELCQELTKRAKEAGDGFLIPVDWENPVRDVPHPLATLKQPIKLTVGPASEKIPASYWLLADGKDPEEDYRYLYYQRAVDRGWKAKVFSWNHNPQRERPDDLVRELVAAIF